MIRYMKRSTISIIFVTAVFAIGLGFGLQQKKKDSSTKPVWEQPIPEAVRQEIQRSVQDWPDGPAKDHMLRHLEVGTVGMWKEELKQSDPKKRARALRDATPEVLSAETAVPAILPLLEDKSAKVRFEAAVALLRFGSDQGVNTLLDLLRAPSDSPRWDLVPVLVRYKKKEAVPVVRELFEKALNQLANGQEDVHPANFIGSLAKAVAAFEDRGSHPLFDRYLRFRLERGLRSTDALEVEAAGRLGEPQLIGLLQEIFRQSTDLRVRVAAAFGLAKLGDESTLMFLMEQASLLRGMPESEAVNKGPEGGRVFPSPALREWSAGKPPIDALFPAVAYLGELKATQAFPLLAELTLAENESLVRTSIKTLALLSDKRAVPVLVKLTKPEHPLRYEAARALMFFDDLEAEQAVRRLYPDEPERAKLTKEARELGPMEFLRP